jgi:predicted alpha/beta hydrolase family esterase
VETLEGDIAAAKGPVVLVAHSLGCLAVARCARSPAIHGALLVTPPDVERPDFPPIVEGFAPIPREPLSFPSVVVASQNDPFTAFERARELAAAWGSRLVDAGAAGHINSDSGFGPWPLGEQLLAELRR